MVPSRTVLASLLLVGLTAEAGAQCTAPPPTVTLSTACVGETAVGSATFCFAPETGCLGTGVVTGIVSPLPPFTVSGMHVDGALGSRPVTDADFPLLLLPGDTLAADVAAALAVPGPAAGQLGWIVSTDATSAVICNVALAAGAPACAGATPANPCAGEVCVAGACVPTPVGGACDDGDPCTVGDTCVNGACAPGLPVDCSTDRCATGAVCVAGACVGGAPVSCDDGNPCTADSCDPLLGCLHVPSDALCQSADPCTVGTCDAVRGCVPTPLTGPACDDGDACTTGDRCTAGVCRGEPVQCPDAFDCTDDRCVAGACQHVPIDARCGSDQCAAGACRPGDPGADARGCLSVPVTDGQECTDDGVSCTDDVCTGGACLHVPIDSRCSAGQCQAVVCAPERSDSDANGCATGPPPASGAGGGAGSGGAGTGSTGGGSSASGGSGSAGSGRAPADPGSGDGGGKDKKTGKKGEQGDGGGGGDGEQGDASGTPAQCAEDGDPCTDDVCTDGRCVHTPVPDATTCEPVKVPFRKALGLAALTRALMATDQSAHADASRAAPGMNVLDRVEQDLEGAVLSLSGKADGALVASPAAIAETPAQTRARIAFTHVLHTPQQIQTFLAVVAQARARADLGRDASQTLRRRGRLLLRGTKTLKGDLRRIRQVSQTFAR